MSGDSSLSMPGTFGGDSVSRSSGDRMRPSDRDVEVFERALRGENRKASERQGESSNDAEQDLGRKRLQVQTEVAPLSNASTIAATPTVTAPAASHAPPPIDDLIAQYVQMLAVSDPGKLGDPRVMLKLDANLLPQTELFLTRAPEGWVLQANTRSPEAYRVLNDFGPALERRFAARGLGSLQIQTTMQPSAIQALTENSGNPQS